MTMTDEEKRVEIERVTKISGFRVKAHELLAEIDQQLGTGFLRWSPNFGQVAKIGSCS
jgi:hypothetical protein